MDIPLHANEYVYQALCMLTVSCLGIFIYQSNIYGELKAEE